MQRSRALRRTRYLARALRSLAALVLALCVLGAVVRGGSRYFYCPAMQAVMGSACCGGGHVASRSDGERASVRGRDCCEERVLAHLPLASTSSTPPLLDAPVLAVLPRLVQRDVASVSAELRVTPEKRAGPRSAAQRRAELMVFLN